MRCAVRMFNLKILYAEDDHQSRESYVVVLKHYFEEVIEATNGLEALELYKMHEPDIILTDIKMPLMDGLEFISKVREDNKETAIIVLSAYSDHEKLLKAIPLGLSDYIIKPVNGTDFTKKLIDIASKITPQHVIELSHNYQFDTINRKLLKGQENIVLTNNEYKFLLLLSKYIREPVSNKIISHTLWQEDEMYCISKIHSLVTRIRQKAPELIQLVYGFGYKIDDLEKSVKN